MAKGLMKATGKSGLLPRPKQIFKQPFKHEVYKKPTDTGYADGILHPKKISRDYILPKVSTPEKLLKKSAMVPKKEYTDEEISKMPISQQFKIKNAKMRREYLKESYETEVKRLERIEEHVAKIKIEEEKAELENKLHKASRAELYTAPTVESYLEGPLVRPRTDEENEILKSKRESNRLETKLKIDQERANSLFELYNGASNFAITEERLELMVDSAFNNTANESWEYISSLRSSSINATKSDNTFDNEIVNIVMDNVNGGPGFEQVNDYLNGFTDDLQQLADQIKRENNEKSLKEAEKLLDEHQSENKSTETETKTDN